MKRFKISHSESNGLAVHRLNHPALPTCKLITLPLHTKVKHSAPVQYSTIQYLSVNSGGGVSTYYPTYHEFESTGGVRKKGLLLFDYACHPCTGTMLIFSVYLSVCLMSQPEGWTLTFPKKNYINSYYVYIPPRRNR